MSDTPYFTPAQARAQESSLSSTTTYPDELIDAMRVAVETDLEDLCKVAFVPRAATEFISAPVGRRLVTEWAYPSTVTACSINGEDFTTDQLAEVVVLPKESTLYRRCGWQNTNPGCWTVYNDESFLSLAYSHGMAAVPGRVQRAAIKATARFLIDTPVSDRATQVTNPDGTQSWLVTAGVGSALYDVPEVNAIITHYDMRARVG